MFNKKTYRIDLKTNLLWQSLIYLFQLKPLTEPTKEQLTTFAHYGNKEVENLAKHFSTIVTVVKECTCT